jgi:hypothetical protein
MFLMICLNLRHLAEPVVPDEPLVPEVALKLLAPAYLLNLKFLMNL